MTGVSAVMPGRGRLRRTLVVSAAVVAATSVTWLVSGAAQAQSAPLLVWSTPVAVDASYFTSMDCVSVSLCVAGDADGNILTSTNPGGGASAWSAAAVGAGPLIFNISCPSTSLCLATDDNGDLLTSTNPTGGASAWSVSDVDPNSAISSLSCPTTSLCVAGDYSGDVLISTDPAGGGTTWNFTPIRPGFEHYTIDVSCPTADFCFATASFGGGNSRLFSSTDGGNSWQQIAVIGPAKWINSVSCPTTLLCVAAGGYYFNGSTTPSAAILSSTDPTDGTSWNPLGVDSPNNNDLGYLSCTTAAFCVAGPLYPGSLVSTDPAGQSPADWQQTGGGDNAVSCPTTTFCVSGDDAGQIQIGVPPQFTATTLTPSVGRVTYGHEQGETLTVQVQPQVSGSGVPTGTVAVFAGAAQVCSVTLMNGAGSCQPSPAQLSAGSYQLTAKYQGSWPFQPSSTTASTSLAVSRARSATKLKLSVATVKYGHEQSERLSVTVLPQFVGIPTGHVTITVGTTVCRLMLYRGRASCTLRPKQLRSGSYQLKAAYGGTANFNKSTSKAVGLTVKP
jgi:hypothetical protein